MKETVIDSDAMLQTYIKMVDNGAVAVTVPFYNDIYWGILPSGEILTVHSDDYSVRKYSPELILIYEHKIDCPKRKVTSKDKDEYFSSFDQSDRIWMKDVIEFPKYKPHFTQLNMDHEGYILLDRDEGDKDEGIYHVLDPECQFVGEVKLPKLKSSAILTKGMIYNLGLLEDQDFVVYRYKLK